MTTTSISESVLESEPVQNPREHVERQILASLDVTVPRTAVSSGYGIALALLAGWLALIPLVYLALLAFLAYLVVWHAYQLFDTFSDGPYFVFHLPMTFIGGLLLLFLIKPVFFRRRPGASQILTLSERDEPLLFAYVRKLCIATASKPPARIEVDCDANAHARWRRGIISMFGGDLVLRIGLPLAGELSLRQFTGVLAHEFGHFNQRHGMSGSYLIRRMTTFFAQIVFQRDKLDDRLLRHRHSNNVLRKIYYWILLGPIEAARGVLWLMLVIGELLTCGVLRRMEYDADRMEALVAGTSDFIRTSRSLAFLQFASRLSRVDLMEAWEDRRLADDLPRLTVLNGRYLSESRGELLKLVEREKTRWLDTHPCHNDRIRQVELLGAQGLLRCDASAEQLFSDFSDLCRRATSAYYRGQLGEKAATAQVVATPAFAAERVSQRQAYRTLRRFLRGHVALMQPVFPHADADRPLENPAEAAAALRAARESMLRSAEKLGTGTRQMQKDAAVIAAARAQMDLCGIFNRTQQVARIEARASRALRRTEPPHGDARRKYEPFADAARARLTVALRLIQSEGINWPRAGGGENYVSATRSRAAQLVSLCRSLEPFVTPMNRLSNLAISIQVLSSAHHPQRPHQPLVRKILATLSETADILRSLWRELSAVPFPYTHATPGISVGGVLVPGFPQENDPQITHACAVTALDAWALLVTRVLAELTQLAEQAEEAASLDALADPVAEDDPAGAGRGRASAIRYWLSYGTRATAGVAMFSGLVWLSIHPPILPAMPWEEGAPPGGYQPNSFQVPFVPPPAPIRYNPAAPGGHPGPMMPQSQRPGMRPPPQRPGMPLPPGSPQRQRSTPWFQPSGPSQPSSPQRYSPSPWGGGGGGGSPSRGGGGGGGGGHR